MLIWTQFSYNQPKIESVGLFCRRFDTQNKKYTSYKGKIRSEMAVIKHIDFSISSGAAPGYGTDIVIISKTGAGKTSINILGSVKYPDIKIKIINNFAATILFTNQFIAFFIILLL